MDAPLATQVERIGTAPEKRPRPSLYKAREKIHPRLIPGTFRNIKWALMAVTLTVYYVTPWLRWDRGPGVPDQAVLIDFPARRFYFFFIEIWPQEFYFVAGLLIMAAIGLFLMTSIAGRIWCGFLCPQTVWTDLYIHVERLIAGDRNARIRLDRAPWTLEKVAKRTAEHAIWILIAMLTGGAWVFYFSDAPELAKNLATFEAPTIAYITVGVLTFTTYTLGGLMREQVCTYMCPWPRIMGAMMDEESLLITYRSARGEPRASVKKARPDAGDCVDCLSCVTVCPMGSDVRDGQQLTCIACGVCIDACNGTMDRLNRPRRLIDYASLAGEARAAQGLGQRTRIVRPRTLIYLGIWSAVGLLMLYALAVRSDIDVNVIRDRNPLFIQLGDGSIRNAYTLKVLNKSYSTRSFHIAVDGLERSDVLAVGVSGVANVRPVLTVDPDSLRSFRIFVTAPKSSVKKHSREIEFVLMDINGGPGVHAESVFIGPHK